MSGSVIIHLTRILDKLSEVQALETEQGLALHTILLLLESSSPGIIKSQVTESGFIHQAKTLGVNEA